MMVPNQRLLDESAKLNSCTENRIAGIPNDLIDISLMRQANYRFPLEQAKPNATVGAGGVRLSARKKSS
jgi:hypothetical protein